MKFERRRHALLLALVAPHWGAWIEIIHAPLPTPQVSVAPHWGAWIEIARTLSTPRWNPSHPTGVRGLKYHQQRDYRDNRQVAPHWGAWIEMSRWLPNARAQPSHPTGVRGLK